MLEVNPTCIRFLSLYNVVIFLCLCCKDMLHVLDFLLPCYNVVVGKMLMFVLEVNLAHAKFLSPCNVDMRFYFF